MGALFFILAYDELFSSGANLPGGSVTEYQGAYDNYWNPQWRLIASFAPHGILAGWLMSLLLIRIDREQIPNSLWGFGAVCLVLAFF